MKTLVIGSGGREHAIAKRILQDKSTEEVLVYPGNAGMEYTKNLKVFPATKVCFDGALELVKKHQVDLVVIGPEAYLYEGYVDLFLEQGIFAFGPSAAAAILEKSKIDAKMLMKKRNIPTASFDVIESVSDAEQKLKARDESVGSVVKISGPAQGKGVFVTSNQEETIQVLKSLESEDSEVFKKGVLLEEKIFGKEISLFYLCGDRGFTFLSSACDHKRLLDQDLGPNTGGMGAYSPADGLTKEFLQSIEQNFVSPTLDEMSLRGTPFFGVLFLGLMLTEKGPMLLEYNVRFGDPETQAILPRLQGDFSQALVEVAKRAQGTLFNKSLFESKLHSVHVVKAAKGYPGIFGTPVEAGASIECKDESILSDSSLYFAGVKKENNQLLTSGGRVLGITALGESKAFARAVAYEKLKMVHFSGEQFRKDIGSFS